MAVTTNEEKKTSETMAPPAETKEKEPVPAPPAVDSKETQGAGEEATEKIADASESKDATKSEEIDAVAAATTKSGDAVPPTDEKKQGEFRCQSCSVSCFAI